MLFSILAFFASTALAVNITRYQNTTLFASPLAAPFAASNVDAIVASFNALCRTTTWNLLASIPVEGDTGEPEGMVRIGNDRFVVSTGEWTANRTAFGKNYDGSAIIRNGTDREPGAGYARLNVYDSKGKRVAAATYAVPGDAEYHLGGIDYDGKYIWATIAQYRPNTTATILRVDPNTMEATYLHKVSDHLGGIVHDTQTDKLYTLNWGSRNASTFYVNGVSSSGFTKPEKVVRNPSYFIDYQDCKWLGHPAYYQYRPTMICSGVAYIGTQPSGYNLGGVAIVDAETMVPLSEVPIALLSKRNGTITQNPFDVDFVNGTLRMYWMPDQHNSTIYVYEAQPGSPYQYGGTGGGGASFANLG